MNAKLLRVALAKKEMTQGQLAKNIGISQNSMSRKIRGKREFTISEADKICTVLEIDDPNEIFLPKKSQMCNGCLE